MTKRQHKKFQKWLKSLDERVDSLEHNMITHLTGDHEYVDTGEALVKMTILPAPDVSGLPVIDEANVTPIERGENVS
jgi:hypothetical protein